MSDPEMTQDQVLKEVIVALADNVKAMEEVENMVMEDITELTDYVKNTANTASSLLGIVLKFKKENALAFEAAKEWQALGKEQTQTVDAAISAMRRATERHTEALEALQGVRWGRVGMFAIVALLCGSVGFFAAPVAKKYAITWKLRDNIRQDVLHPDCAELGGEALTLNENPACVIYMAVN